MTESYIDYFIELHPGKELEEIVREQKEKVIKFLGDSEVDGSNTRFLRDPPHFTLYVARAEDFDAALAAYREAARKVPELLDPLDFGISGVEEEMKDGLVEVHGVVHPFADVYKFRVLQETLMKASLPYLTLWPHPMFLPANFEGEARRNVIDWCYPYVGQLYNPHISIGRFHPTLMPRVRQVIQDFDPRGRYSSDELVVWQYVPGDPNSRVYNPTRIRLGSSA